MYKKVWLFAAALALGGAAALPPSAIAGDHGYQGTLCSPAYPLDNDLLRFTRWGVHNDSHDTYALVACGAAPGVGEDVYRVDVTVYDRNDEKDVCCTMQVQRLDGGILSSAERCSSGSGADSQRLSWVPPVNDAGTVNLECTIPVATSQGFSHVTSYRVLSNP